MWKRFRSEKNLFNYSIVFFFVRSVSSKMISLNEVFKIECISNIGLLNAKKKKKGYPVFNEITKSETAKKRE